MINTDKFDVPFTEVLFQLCENNNHEALSLVLEKLPATENDDIINIRDASGQTPLYAAVASRASQCTKVLLENGADPNYACSAAYFCRTPLHFCASEGSPVEIMELLLNHGAEPLLQDLHGETCLSLATRYGHSDLYSLMTTCSEQREQMFDLILSQGDIDAAKNCITSIRSRKQTFLKHLSKQSHSLVVQCIEHNLDQSLCFLADNGIDCLSISLEPNCDSILHLAARHGKEKVVNLILDKWPALFCRTSALGRLPLHDACERGQANIVKKFLLYNFPRSLQVLQQSPYGCYDFPIDLNHVDADSRTALLEACSSGSTDTVKALLDSRFTAVDSSSSGLFSPFDPAQPNTETPVGSLSTYVSSFFRKMKVPSTGGSVTGGIPFSYSFQMGASAALLTPTSRPTRSGSAISLEDQNHVAFSDFEIVSPQPKPSSPGAQFSPIDMNVFSYDRTTPLLTAIRIQNKAMVSLLLQSGSDPELPAQWRGYNITPLHAAVELRDGDLIDLLLQSGASDNDCSALESALRSAPHLVPIFLRRWSEVDREVQINVESVAELAEISRCKTESVVPVAINWRAKPQLRDLPQAWIVGCSTFHNPALILDDFVACSVITRIDISANAIRTLPSYLFHMQSLRTLNAASNQIDDISAGGIQRSFLSTSLREIDLSYNRLVTIPSFIYWLKNLTKLYADYNSISSLPSDIWDNSSLTELRLAHNRLESLPSRRFGRSIIVKSQTESILSNSSTLTRQQQRQSRLTAMESSRGDKQQTELQQHDLWSIELSDNVGFIADEGPDSTLGPNCSSLRYLDISNNQINSVPNGLVCLCPLLRTLVLSNNNISSVSCWPAEFPPMLHTLDLSHNCVKVFPEVSNDFNVVPCSNPAQLVEQDGKSYRRERARSGTRPDSRRVRSRSVDRRKGADTEWRLVTNCSHRQHSSLNRLRTLNLSKNGLTAFNFDSLTAPGITQLDLSSNKLHVLPTSIALLQNLSVLNVSNTQITTLPSELSRLTRLWSLEVSNCPLSGELGSLVRGKVRTADIIYHLRASLDRARLRPITRLIVIGLTGSGKSTLIEALKRASNLNSPSPQVQDRSKPLIDWGQLNVDYKPDGPLTFRVAELSTKPDFRYIGANFLTKRCVVMVTFRLSEYPTSHTVDAIASMVRDVNLLIPSSPVLIVGTCGDVVAENTLEAGAAEMVPLWRRKLTVAFQQVDLNPSIGLNSSEIFDMSINSNDSSGSTDEAILPGNCKLIAVSATKNRKKNGTRLLKEIHRLAFEWRGGSNHASFGRAGQGSGFNAPATLKQTVPAIFADAENAVSKLATKEKSHLLSRSEFQSAVKKQLAEANVKCYRDVDELQLCVKFLHETGLMMHFNEPSIDDLYFLSIQWLSNLLALVIKAAPNAILPIKDAFDIVKKLDSSKLLSKSKFLALLARFDAAISLDDDVNLLVPGLLPTIDEPKGISVPLKQVSKHNRKSFRMSLPDIEAPAAKSISFDINRFYLINHVPMNLWARLAVRLLTCELLTEIMNAFDSESHSPTMQIWDSRLEIFNSSQSVICVEQVDRSHLRAGALKWSLELSGQMLWSVTNSVSLISVRVPGDIFAKFSSLTTRLISLVTELIDQLLEDWYPAIGSRFAQDTLGSYLIYRLIPCQECFAGEDLAMVPCYLFEECMANVSGFKDDSTPVFEKDSLSCSKGHFLDIKSAAPDLLFCDISKSQLVECSPQTLDKSSLLGCGALGPVLSVTVTKLQKNGLLGGDSFFPQTGSFGKLSSSKLVAVKFFNPVDCSEFSSQSSGMNSNSSAPSISDQYRRLNDQLRRRFKADPVRLACEAYTNARQELSILSCLRHPNVVHLVGVSIKPLGLLLQLAPSGSLFDWLQTYRRVGQQLTSSTLVQVIAQISDALAYLHRLGVIYRDLKSSNILVWRFPRPTISTLKGNELSSLLNMDLVQVRISDFSIARWSGGFGCRGQAGTPGFMAPEVIQYNGEETYTEKVDCFSFGMVMYELLTLRLPFEDRPSVNARHAVMTGMRPPPTLAMFTYGQVFTDLVAMCWRRDPSERPPASEISRIANWPGITRIVSISSIDGLPELMYAASIPVQAAHSTRGAILARWSSKQNKTYIDSLGFDGDECFSLQRLAEHPFDDSPSTSKSKGNSDTQQQVIMVTCLTMSSQLLFASDVAGLIHCYKLASGEYLGCIPAGRTGCHVVSLYCCNASLPGGQDTLLALYSSSLLVVLHASPTSNPVLAPVSRIELDPTKGTACCMAVIRRLNNLAMTTSTTGPIPHASPPKIKERIGLFEKKASSSRLKSLFSKTIPSEHRPVCGPGVDEIWLGCFDGSLLICLPKSLATPTRLRAPNLVTSTQANKDSTPPSPKRVANTPIASLVADSNGESVFATLYLSSVVARWSVRQRILLAHFDFGEQITSILPQSSRLLLGTLTGCIVSSDLNTLRPLSSFPLHAESTLALLPISSQPGSEDGANTDLVVSLGRGLSEPLSTMLPDAAPTTRMCVVSLSFSS